MYLSLILIAACLKFASAAVRGTIKSEDKGLQHRRRLKMMMMMNDCDRFRVHLKAADVVANRSYFQGTATVGTQPCVTSGKGDTICVGDVRTIQPIPLYEDINADKIVGEYTSTGIVVGASDGVIKVDNAHSIRFKGHSDFADGSELFFVDHAATGQGVSGEIIMAITGGIGDLACATGYIDWFNQNFELDIYICDTCA